MKVCQYLMQYPYNTNVSIKVIGSGEIYNGILSELKDAQILNANFYRCNVKQSEEDSIKYIEVHVTSEELQKNDIEPVWKSWEQFFVKDKSTFHNMFTASLRHINAVDLEDEHAYKQRKEIEEFYERYNARLEMEFFDITGKSLTEVSRELI